VERYFGQTPVPSAANWNFAIQNTHQDIKLQASGVYPLSTAHAQVYVINDGIAVLFAVGNYPNLPTVHFFDHSDSYLAAGSLPAADDLYFYEQQSQAVEQPGTDTLFFTGLASQPGVNGANLWDFSVIYTPGGGGPCGQAVCFGAPTEISGTFIPQNQIKDHSWHVSMAYSASADSIYLAYGVDGQLYVETGTIGSGPTVTWSPSPSPGLTYSLVNGMSLFSGSTGVGAVWVEDVGPYFAVYFAVL
jgi:hypothetical protein